MNIRRVIGNLYVFGAVLIASAVTGVSLISTNTDGLHITHYSGHIFQIPIAVGGGVAFYAAWCIKRRTLLGWRLYFLVLALLWMAFPITGTQLVASQYPKTSQNDELLFAAMLALVSCPVFVYWGWKWWKEKVNFEIA